jgi:ubiquinone/menaquinone biosynthesis C-methylase UbiE
MIECVHAAAKRMPCLADPCTAHALVAAPRFVNGLPRGAVVGDFGCGEAKLARSVRHKVHSFDLVAPNDHVVACDIANVPLADGCLDAVIFSLSLMGTNYPAFLAEAWRVLKPRYV